MAAPSVALGKEITLKVTFQFADKGTAERSHAAVKSDIEGSKHKALKLTYKGEFVSEKSRVLSDLKENKYTVTLVMQKQLTLRGVKGSITVDRNLKLYLNSPGITHEFKAGQLNPVIKHDVKFNAVGMTLQIKDGGSPVTYEGMSLTAGGYKTSLLKDGKLSIGPVFKRGQKMDVVISIPKENTRDTNSPLFKDSRNDELNRHILGFSLVIEPNASGTIDITYDVRQASPTIGKNAKINNGAESSAVARPAPAQSPMGVDYSDPSIASAQAPPVRHTQEQEAILKTFPKVKGWYSKAEANIYLRSNYTETEAPKLSDRLPISDFRWVVSQPQEPVYGFASVEYDYLAYGRTIVKGSFMVNVGDHLAVERAISNANPFGHHFGEDFDITIFVGDEQFHRGMQGWAEQKIVIERVRLEQAGTDYSLTGEPSAIMYAFVGRRITHGKPEIKVDKPMPKRSPTPLPASESPTATSEETRTAVNPVMNSLKISGIFEPVRVTVKRKGDNEETYIGRLPEGGGNLSAEVIEGASYELLATTLQTPDKTFVKDFVGKPQSEVVAIQF